MSTKPATDSAVAAQPVRGAADPFSPRLLRALWLAAIVLMAFGLRAYRLGTGSLWYDETVSAYLAGEGLPALVAHTAGDIHPPGYYLLLHLWVRVAGSSGFSLAFLSMLWGMLLVALSWRLGARVFGRRAGPAAGLLVALSPYNLWYSQEVRMYTMGAALGLGLLLVVISMVSAGRESRPSWSRTATYAVLGALGLWVLYYYAFLLVAINLMVMAWWAAGTRRGDGATAWVGRWGLAQAGVLVLYAPWISVAWRQATLPPVPPWRGFTGLGQVAVETWSALSLGQSIEPGAAWPVLAGVTLLFGLGVAAGVRGQRAGFRQHRTGPHPQVARRSPPGGGNEILPWLLAGHVLLPVFLIYLASLAMPLYHVRYAFTYSPPFYVLLAAGLVAVGRLWRPAAGIVLVGLLFFCGVSIVAYHTDTRYASDDHRGAVRFLADRWRPGDAILVNAGYVYTALEAYWDGDPIAWRGRLTASGPGMSARGPMVVGTGTVDGPAGLGWGDPASDFYAMSYDDTAKALESLFAGFDRVWVYRCYDTVTDPEGWIRAWLVAHGRPFEDQVFSGEAQLRVQGYLTGRDPRAGAPVDWGEGLADGTLKLEASSVAEDRVPVGGALDIAVVWRTDRTEQPELPEPILFAGLFDTSGGRWAQVDERPLGSLFPVGAWPVGSLVRTPVRIPVPIGTPPGPYRLEIGWYRFEEGQPVWEPWMAGHRLLLAEVDITAPSDWEALPRPAMAYRAGVEIGPDVHLLGFGAQAVLPVSRGGAPERPALRPSFEVVAGASLALDLYWQARVDGPQAGPAVLQLRDGAERVAVEAASAPAGGRAPFVGLVAGQAVRDPWVVEVPVHLAPGMYDLVVGRRDLAGRWLQVRRGLASTGETYPLATVRVMGP